MSFIGAFKKGQPAAKAAPVDRPAVPPNRLHLADQLRFRQIERMLERTLEELAQAKERICRLEKTLAEQHDGHITGSENSIEHSTSSSTLSLPVEEISQLAQMAKRLR
jgi:hypothetical protein